MLPFKSLGQFPIKKSEHELLEDNSCSRICMSWSIQYHLVQYVSNSMTRDGSVEGTEVSSISLFLQLVNRAPLQKILELLAEFREGISALT